MNRQGSGGGGGGGGGGKKAATPTTNSKDIMASSSNRQIGLQIGSAWFQRKINLRPQHRGVHLVTEEILRQIPELSYFSVGLCHIMGNYKIVLPCRHWKSDFCSHCSAWVAQQGDSLNQLRSAFEWRFFFSAVQGGGIIVMDTWKRKVEKREQEEEGWGVGDVPVHVKLNGTECTVSC